MKAQSEPIVETNYGKVRGALADGVYAFKGVRYGAPTGGENRFMPPQKPKPWSGVQDALQFGAQAPQTNPNPPGSGPSPIIMAQLLPRPAPGAAPPPRPPEGEDCLFLNVWTSGLNDGRKRPVMFWLHGGFFYTGSGASVDGSRLANRGDVVVVSVNHRLNAFGYSHLGDIAGADYEHSGNAGMLDILAALEWVRDNIERFGGDPQRVMVFGESGGGMKTSFLMASPAAQGLIHRAGVQSGPGLRMMERDPASEVSQMMLAELGLKPAQVGALKTLPMEKLLATYYTLVAKLPGNFIRLTGRFTDLNSFAPVIDAKLLPRHPFHPKASPLARDIPMLIGWNQTEMTFFMGADAEGFSLDEAGLRERAVKILGDQGPRAIEVYRKVYADHSPSQLYIQMWSDVSIMRETLIQADRHAADNDAAVYLYRFDWQTPVLSGKLGSMHTLESPFVFDTAGASRFIVGPAEGAQPLAGRMSEAWASFAATGDPNSGKSGLPRWPTYDAGTRPTMLFNNESTVANDPTRVERAVLELSEE